MPVEHDNAKEDAGMGGGGGGSTIDGVTVSGTPSTGQVITATSSANANWQNPPGGAPSGSAGGDLSGTYPNPGVAKVDGVAVSGTPSVGKVLTATSSTAADWQTPSVSVIDGVSVSGTPSSGQVLTATSSSAADWQAPAGSFTEAELEAIFPGPVIYTAAASGDGYALPAGAQGQVLTVQNATGLPTWQPPGFMGRAPVSIDPFINGVANDVAVWKGGATPTPHVLAVGNAFPIGQPGAPTGQPTAVASSQGKAPFTVAATLPFGGSSTFEGFVCAISTTGPKFVAVGLDSSTKLWCSISTDFGSTWTDHPVLQSGGGALPFVLPSTVAVSANAGTIVIGWQGTSPGAVVSSDSGSTWTALSFACSGLRDSIDVDQTGDIILVGSGTAGLNYSVNAGSSWNTVAPSSLGSGGLHTCDVVRINQDANGWWLIGGKATGSLSSTIAITTNTGSYSGTPSWYNPPTDPFVGGACTCIGPVGWYSGTVTAPTGVVFGGSRPITATSSTTLAYSSNLTGSPGNTWVYPDWDPFGRFGQCQGVTLSQNGANVLAFGQDASENQLALHWSTSGSGQVPLVVHQWASADINRIAMPGDSSFMVLAGEAAGFSNFSATSLFGPFTYDSVATNTVTITSGTAFWLDWMFDRELIIPVTFNPTSGAAATALVELKPTIFGSGSFVTLATETVPLGTTFDGTVRMMKVTVPGNWQARVTVTNATIGTATYY